jgi:pantoate--beta-alanine ligase
MQTIFNTTDLQEQLVKIRANKLSVGLVPTMGNLHGGHIKLVEEAKKISEIVVSTIFVNPIQFGEGEDFANYPRTLGKDKAKLEAANCDILFVPTVEEIYGEGLSAGTVISVPDLSLDLCGNKRPGHFDGVATIVTKLLNISRADQAFFGLKDYQQYLIVRKLVKDLSLSTQIIGVKTQRETNGLAMSSRNNYLSVDEKQKAKVIFSTLKLIAEKIISGERNYVELEKIGFQTLQNSGAEVDYFAIRNDEFLQKPTLRNRNLVILAAAKIGPSRLIDNLLITI